MTKYPFMDFKRSAFFLKTTKIKILPNTAIKE